MPKQEDRQDALLVAAINHAVEFSLAKGTVLRVRECARDIAHAHGLDEEAEGAIAERLSVRGIRHGVTIEFQKRRFGRVPESWEEYLDQPRP